MSGQKTYTVNVWDARQFDGFLPCLSDWLHFDRYRWDINRTSFGTARKEGHSLTWKGAHRAARRAVNQLRSLEARAEETYTL